MPKYRMSPQQEMKFMHVLSGDIPLTAVAQYNMNAFKYNISDWTDYYKGMNMGQISMDRYREIKKSEGIVASWQGTHRGLVERDEAAQLESREAERIQREARIDREEMASRIFYRAVAEGDWETAKSMTYSFGALRQIYIDKFAEAHNMKWLIDAVQEKAAFKAGIQCVAFIGKILNAYYGEKIYTGDVGGQTGHGREMLTKIVRGDRERYEKNFSDITQFIKNSKYQSFQFGDLVQLPGSFGHVMMFVGYTPDGQMKFAEAVGGVSKMEQIGVTRWSGYSPEMYEDIKGEKNLKQHIQIYDADYFTKREEEGRGMTQALRMRNLDFDYNKAEELLDFMLPSGTEKGGGYNR